MKPLPSYMTLEGVFAIEAFIQDCTDGWLIDYDGFGYLCDEAGNYDDSVRIYPSDVTRKVNNNLFDAKNNKNFTHILWFNR